MNNAIAVSCPVTVHWNGVSYTAPGYVIWGMAPWPNGQWFPAIQASPSKENA
jgi:hypothetical protein